MKIVITVDTEEDNQWDFDNPISTTENINYIPPFQELCNLYGLKPTYLCTYGVLKSRRFDTILKPYQDEGIAEIGAHLHPWVNPPFEGDSQEDLCRHPFPSELPVKLFQEKMQNLTNLIIEKTGRRPVSYRAGRWGFCKSHIPVLLELNYKIDCSVTPLLSWGNESKAGIHRVDFRQATVKPYFLDFDDVSREGKSQLLEIPVTIFFMNRLMRSNNGLCLWFLRYDKTLVGRFLNKLLGFRYQWLRLFPHTTVAMLKAVYIEACRRKLPVVEMMLHSSELMPKGSPSYPTKQSVERLYDKLESFFNFVAENKAKGMTLAEFATNCC